MISLLAVGNGSYPYSDLEKITCAGLDVRNVYNTFKDVFKEEFSQFNSIAIENVSWENYKKVLYSARNSYTADDTVVLYFSGHAVIENQEFHMYFNEYRVDDRHLDKVSLSRLNDELRVLSCRVVVILDCCHSEGGLSLANKDYLSVRNKISVLASSNIGGFSEFGEGGSVFTNLFISALKVLNETKSEISLNAISDYIKEQGAVCLINTEEGLGDIILKQETSMIQWEPDFPEKFISKLYPSIPSTRELLWYSLLDAPDFLRFKTLSHFFSEIPLSIELNWIVRRAIGTVLNGLNFKHENNIEIALNLVQDINWAKKCIGVIGLRYMVDDEVVYSNLRKLLLTSKEPMDVIWLTNLYLSQSKHFQVTDAFLTTLASTEWGVVEIWKTLSFRLEASELIQLIVEKVEPSLLGALTNHLYLRNVQINYSLLPPIDQDVTNSKLIQQLYKTKSRDIISQSDIRNKWLISHLYGVWRDQIRFPLQDFIDSFPDDGTVETELKNMSKCPLVEMRMAILQFFKDHQEFFEKYRDSLVWALVDPHPWVRRTALSLFKDDPILKMVFNDMLDKMYYPGIFDLFLEAKEIEYAELAEYVQKYELSKIERDMLRKNGLII